MAEVSAITYDGGDYTVPGYISARLMAAYDFPTGATLHVGIKTREPDGRIRYRYVLEQDGDVIFDGDDFRTGCWAEVDYAEAARSLLGFLTLREGDTDADYFDRYTPEQLAWRDEYAEGLSIYAD
jgi:hypothetical protein